MVRCVICQIKAGKGGAFVLMDRMNCIRWNRLFPNDENCA